MSGLLDKAKEAEASKKGEFVAVRQIISDKETYKFDLENFDWFLIKTGKQGKMENSARFLIEEELKNDNNFIIHKKWELPDKSYLSLIKRNSPTVTVKKVVCSNKKPLINLKPITNGLKVTVIGEGKKLESSKILLDIKSNTHVTKENISIANGLLHPNFNKNDCYSIEQNSPIKIESNIFIGHKSIILPGTYIESNVIVGAGSVVKGRLLTNTVYAGVPAKPICSIEEYFKKNSDKFMYTKLMSRKNKKKYLLTNIEKL